MRPVELADRPSVLALLSASLGVPLDETFERFFAWKHEQNPFGASPAWVMVDDDRVVGFRTFMRWEFNATEGGLALRAARAVDTATHPEYQGRGIFRSLTLHGIDRLREEGVRFVFNTPNSKSRPGYLSMGWVRVGILPIAFRPMSVVAPARMLRARGAADRWSLPSSAGDPAPDVLGDERLVRLLDRVRAPAGIWTRRTADFLRWRYAFEPLAYRAVTLHGDVAEGVAVFRVRRRGAATEAVLCDVLVADGDPRARRQLERRVAAATRADYVLRVGGPPADAAGYVRLPRQGPVLTYRTVSSADGVPPLAAWDLTLGDVELF